VNRIAIIICALVAIGSIAHADKKTQVFPLSGSGLPDKLTAAPAKLTKALAACSSAIPKAARASVRWRSRSPSSGWCSVRSAITRAAR
jgi:hypothetical protein